MASLSPSFTYRDKIFLSNFWKELFLAMGTTLKKKEIGEVAYHPLEAAIHNVFHVSQLKLKLGKQQRVQHMPPMLTEEFELQLWLETVMVSKELGANEWLVKWKGMLESEATWESVYQMNQQFSTFHLEDKYPGVPDSPCPQGESGKLLVHLVG
ncbi:DNA gyrase subunit A [Cucumis melo var. makuwa]|uniref:DNA gyrase subunit A n=1 Tax=Cucumis melo var. makuwa TaxID=1194695 RepID=A0A5A7STL9_CUCMM|nr:DNA gyrase subunit A [Cucumis melo var. makuwa]TYK02567.1 DNA gyrase subunit A [Cucumis melo var. makuwa]